MTQKNKAWLCLVGLDAHSSALQVIHKDLERIVSAAQNAPPQGDADGTIHPTEWANLKTIERTLGALLYSLDHCRLSPDTTPVTGPKPKPPWR